MIPSTSKTTSTTLIWQSFGATRVLLSFLEELQALRLQQLNKFWYNVAVGRAQVKVTNTQPTQKLMILSTNDKGFITNNVMMYDYQKKDCRRVAVLSDSNVLH